MSKFHDVDVNVLILEFKDCSGNPCTCTCTMSVAGQYIQWHMVVMCNRAC